MARRAGQGAARGHIRKRGNSYQVLVRAGVDPLTGRELRLTESTTDKREAERILNRLRAEVDTRHNARTRATLGTAIARWLAVHEAEESTLDGYRGYVRRCIEPALGAVSLARLTAQTLEEFYAELRRCRHRCHDRIEIDHRTTQPHDCRLVRHRRPPGRPPAGGHPEHHCAEAGCKVIECKPHRDGLDALITGIPGRRVRRCGSARKPPPALRC